MTEVTRIKFDVLSQAYLIVGIMASTFFITYYSIDPDTAFISLFMMALMFGGITVGITWKFLTVDAKILDFTNILYYSLIAIIGLLVTQLLAFNALANATNITSVEARLMLGILAGIAEETFFRGVILPWLLARTKSPLFAIVGNSLMFSVTHMSAYSLLDNPAIFLGLFLNGIVFSAITLYTKRLSIAQSAHIGLNIIASGVL